ncbi:MAG: primosomal protein N' [Nitrospirota bacterium]
MDPLPPAIGPSIPLREGALAGDGGPERFAEVVVAAQPDRLFHYRVPPHLGQLVQPGLRVRVPFGPRVLDGYLVRLLDRAEVDSVKPLGALLDDQPVIDPAILALTRWIADYYLAPWGRVLTASVPAGLKVTAAKRVAVTDAGRVVDLAMIRGAGQRRLLTALRAYQKPISLSRLQTMTGAVGSLGALMRAGWVAEPDAAQVSAPKLRTYVTLAPGVQPTAQVARGRRRQAVIEALASRSGAFVSELGPGALAACRALAARGLVVLLSRADLRDPHEIAPASDQVPVLTEHQQHAVQTIGRALDAGGFAPFLLWGVTGSGKTEVYLHAIASVLAHGRGALLLVPEIALTGQLVARVRGRFGELVAVLHSGLSNAERLTAWSRIRRGEARIALGTRSALFAPLRDVGLIVVDEEQDSSYKQEDGVRYHARDSALVLGRARQAVVVLGSATPSLESYANAASGRYHLVILPERVHARPLPTVRAVDVRADPGADDVFSGALLEAINERMTRREQILLVLNRRGFAPVVICRDCGATAQCARCSVGLTYHRARGRLCCHYCGMTSVPLDRCAVCNGHRVTLQGVGTEQIEARVRAEWPHARIARMDRDTTGTKRAHETLLGAMRRGEADVLVGTQMVAKGHDLPNVTLVGIVNADVGLSLPDFRASERVFHLLIQAAGRAGRGDRPGEVILQTRRPTHDVVVFAQRHDVAGFYERELARRRELGYPPFGRLIILLLSGPKEAEVIAAAQRLASEASGVLRGGVSLLGPAPAPLWRLKGRHRWQLVLKGPKGPAVGEVARALAALALKVLPRSVRLDADVDPQHVL